MTSYQPVNDMHFPMSYAVVGSVIPGVLRRYSVKTVNNFDLTSEVVHRKLTTDPVMRYPDKKFPSMHDKNSKGHPVLEKLKQLLGSKSNAQMKPGFERIRENLAWRGQTQIIDPAAKKRDSITNVAI